MEFSLSGDMYIDINWGASLFYMQSSNMRSNVPAGFQDNFHKEFLETLSFLKRIFVEFDNLKQLISKLQAFYLIKKI